MSSIGSRARASGPYADDGVGHRTQAIEDGVTRNFTGNDADQISGATRGATTATTATTAGYGITAGTYNSVDQTTSFTPNGSAARSNTYAGASQSHWLTSGPVDFETTASLGITRTDDGATVSEFTREPDGRLVSMRRDGESFCYVPDGRGSVSVLTNGAGLTENAYRYGPYGSVGYSLEATPQPFRWNSGYTIDGTTYKYGARYYDTTIGRWTQVGPIPSEPLYANAANDPINKADPSGYSECGGGSIGGLVDCASNPTSADPPFSPLLPWRVAQPFMGGVTPIFVPSSLLEENLEGLDQDTESEVV